MLCRGQIVCAVHMKSDGLLSDHEPSIKAFVGYTQTARKNSRAHTRASVEFCVKECGHSLSTASVALNTERPRAGMFLSSIPERGLTAKGEETGVTSLTSLR